jgi:competence protein ComEA
MRRRALLLMGLLGTAAAQTELDLNLASRAQLESLPGIGPALADRILAARGQQPFGDWSDLQQRVRGIGPALAAKLSAQGLRVHGHAFEPAAATQPPPQS